MTGHDADGLLIAETGENGELLWLWKKEPQERLARPLNPEEFARIHPEIFCISGTDRDNVTLWLRKSALNQR